MSRQQMGLKVSTPLRYKNTSTVRLIRSTVRSNRSHIKSLRVLYMLCRPNRCSIRSKAAIALSRGKVFQTRKMFNDLLP